MTHPDDDGERNRAAEADFLTRARSDFVRGSLWTAIATLVTLPTAFIASIVVARSLGPVGLGQYATYVAAFAIVSVLGNLGWSEATVQWLAAAGARGHEGDSTELIRRCAGYHLCIAGPASAVTAFALLQSSGTRTALFAAAIVWATQILGTSTVILTAGARNATSAQIGLVTSTSAQLGLLTAAVSSREPGLSWTVQLGFVFLGHVLALFALRPAERAALFRPLLFLRPPSGFMVYALSACAAGLVGLLVFGRSEVFALRAYDLLAAAGIFTVVTGLASQLTSPLDSLMAPLTPIAAGLFAIDKERAARTFRRALRVSAALGTIGACVLVPIGVVMLEPVYGASFGSGALPFLALGLVSSLQTVLGPVGAFAFATRSAGQVLGVNLIALAADVVLVILLVPMIGLTGAVAANAGAQLVSLYLLSTVVSRKLDVPMSALVLDIRLFLFGLVLGAGEGLICAEFDGVSRFVVMAVVTVGVACLLVVVRRFPALKVAEEDLALIVRGSSNQVVGRAVEILRRLGVVRGDDERDVGRR